jgi:hypothetical protein
MTDSRVVHVFLKDEDLGVFDFQKFSNSDGFLVENASNGLSPKAFFEGIGELRPMALQTFIWLLYRKQGRIVDRASIDFAIADVRLEEEPDPTEASGGSDVAATSDSSPTTAI